MFNYRITFNGSSTVLIHTEQYTSKELGQKVSECELQFFNSGMTYVDPQQYLEYIANLMCENYGFERMKGIGWEIKWGGRK